MRLRSLRTTASDMRVTEITIKKSCMEKALSSGTLEEKGLRIITETDLMDEDDVY